MCRHVGYAILDIAYGIDNEKRDYLVQLAEEVMAMFAMASEPGRFLVDVIPARESTLVMLRDPV